MRGVYDRSKWPKSVYQRSLTGRKLVTGVKHHKAKLNPKKVAYILASSLSTYALGRMFGVHAGTIGHVRRRETWKEKVVDPYYNPKETVNELWNYRRRMERGKKTKS